MSVKVFPSLSSSLGSNGRGWAKPKDTVQSHTTAQVHSSSMQRLGRGLQILHDGVWQTVSIRGRKKTMLAG